MASKGGFDGQPIADPHPSSIKQDYESEEAPASDWTAEEEAKAKRKYVKRMTSTRGSHNAHIFVLRLDFIIMPILTLGFFCLRK